ncbi:phosphate regulon sensor histidine kinase PhoR [Piscinibacter sp.]|uniref:phosphate regulon sensor histidine kinase PhoR n=1 Tax=Piscinibacter sp. TaxID=1903157 RepID=UPI0039E4F45D
MNWLLPRLTAGVLAMLAGGCAGFLVSNVEHTVVWRVLAGGAIGVALAALLDTARGYRLIEWLRGSQEQQAPRDAGFWGELGYRVERSIRLREQGLEQERLRLEQFLSAIEASPNGVMILDAGQQIVWCNGVAADHFGLDPQRDRRQRVTNLVRSPAFVAYLQQARFGAEPVSFANPRGDGTLSVLLRSYGEGMTLVLSQDVTDRERHEAMRRDFVANVSHEIRTPLTVLSGFIETMGNLPLTEVERKRVLELMAQQTGRMQTLVSDLLTLAQLEGSPRPAADRWVPLAPLLAQVESDAKALSGGNHTIEFAAANGIEIAGSHAELLSAVHNLVGNAVRYTPEGGRITVGWQQQADGSGELSVTDTGLGIAREHLPRLTERFYRVDGSRSRDTGGTGLGLSIVKHVVQRHGAELQVDSEPGKGSRFRIVFPAARVRTLG